MAGGGGGWWLRPFLVFSLRLDRTEQKRYLHIYKRFCKGCTDFICFNGTVLIDNCKKACISMNQSFRFNSVYKSFVTGIAE